MKLKTLKELDEGKYMFKGLVRIDHLKQEAIKYIKNLQNKPLPNDLIKKDREKEIFSRGVQKGIIHWIKQFFNITEEDLK